MPSGPVPAMCDAGLWPLLPPSGLGRRPVGGGLMCCQEGQRRPVLVLTLPQASCVTLGKELNLSASELSCLKNGIKVPVFWGVEGVL